MLTLGVLNYRLSFMLLKSEHAFFQCITTIYRGLVVQPLYGVAFIERSLEVF